MELLIGFVLSFSILIFGVLNDFFIGYSLLMSLLIFSIISYRAGNNPKEILNHGWNGGKRAFVVLRIFLLIGLVTASWLSGGTIPAIVYYSMQIMNPRFFILFAFLTSSLVSYMLGTAFGTASTIGIVLIIMARGGDININLAGGAILSGCFFGDRVSPMSSSANLVANITEVQLYPMLKRFRKTTVIPFILTCIIYLLFSLSNPLETVGNGILENIDKYFIVNIIVLLPAIIMFGLSILQVNVRKSMIFSIIVGSMIALSIQEVQIFQLIKTLLFGYKLKIGNPLVDILKGGGIFSMIKPAFVVFISCAMAGILEGMDLFNSLDKLFRKVDSRSRLLRTTGLVSLISSAFGGNQSIAVVMTSQIMKSTYGRLKKDRYELATDISNTTILFAPLIPWNIANLVPATTLNLSPIDIVPYSFYLYIPFLLNYIYLFKKDKTLENTTEKRLI